MSSVALLPPRDFAVFGRQFPLEYYTENENVRHVVISTSSLAAWMPGVNLYLASFLPYAKPYENQLKCQQ